MNRRNECNVCINSYLKALSYAVCHDSHVIGAAFSKGECTSVESCFLAINEHFLKAGNEVNLAFKLIYGGYDNGEAHLGLVAELILNLYGVCCRLGNLGTNNVINSFAVLGDGYGNIFGCIDSNRVC